MLIFNSDRHSHARDKGKTMLYKCLHIFIFFIVLSRPSFAQDLLSVKLASTNANNLTLTFTLENKSDQAIQVLTWNTPFDAQFSSHSFLVVHKEHMDSQIDYIGPLRKRATPSAKDYLLLAAREAVTANINIANYYAINTPGNYLIRFQTFVSVTELGNTPNKTHTIKLISNTVTAYQAQSIQQKTLSVRKTQSCDASQNATIEQARIAARDLANDAVSALNTTPENQRAQATRYTTWFGNYQASRYTTISTNFNKILGAIENPNINFICNSSECDGDTFAFVYSRSPYNVYLCNSFWSAPLTGTDSKAGTIIHEVSHFRIVANTDDFQYGQSGTRQLALSQPDVAINNADSHEYFAENTPFIPMLNRSAEETPAPNSNAQILTLNTPLSGALNAGEWAYYEVSGASSISLFNLSADLDLYIGNNTLPTENNFSCSPFLADTATETCTVNSATTTYIGIKGFTAGSFSLIASTENSNANHNDTLTLDTPLSGRLNTNEWRYFQIIGAKNIRLYNLSADLDLYIGNGTQPTENSFTCRPFQASTTEESCAVNSTETTYIGIRGFATGSFTLIASSTNTDNNNNNTAATLTLEIPVSGSINAEEWAFYTVVDASSIKLFNLSSDLDLYISNNTQPSIDNFSCRPFLSGTKEETCTINTAGITYIGIRGFTAGSYSLVASVGSSNTIDSSASNQTLLLNQVVSGTLNRNEWAYYNVSGATNIRLYNLTEDLDLYVNTTAHPTFSQFTCRPFLENTDAESCNISSTGINYIGINGYHAGSYSLIATNNNHTTGSSIRVALNQNNFITNDIFQLNMIVTGSGEFDTYIGLIFPDGSLYTFSQPFNVNPLNTILPYQRNIYIDNEANYSILRLRLPNNNIPLGRYQACSLLLYAGLPLTQENVLSSDCNAFDIN